MYRFSPNFHGMVKYGLLSGQRIPVSSWHYGFRAGVIHLLYSMMDRPFMVCRITMRIHQWWISRESKGETAICISAGLIRKKKQLLWISRWSRNGLWQILRYERMPVRWHYREDPLYIVWKKKIMVQICICFR